jgi:hypothetical protein
MVRSTEEDPVRNLLGMGEPAEPVIRRPNQQPTENSTTMTPDGSTPVGGLSSADVTAKQAQLRAVLDKLKAMGKELPPGAEGLLQAQAGSYDAAGLADLNGQLEVFERAASGELLQAKAGEAVAAVTGISGAREESPANLFVSLTSGIGALMGAGRERDDSVPPRA